MIVILDLIEASPKSTIPQPGYNWTAKQYNRDGNHLTLYTRDRRLLTPKQNFSK
jgi:hypothetical protein